MSSAAPSFLAAHLQSLSRTREPDAPATEERVLAALVEAGGVRCREASGAEEPVDASPSGFEDPFAGVRGLPEIEGAELTGQSLRAAILGHGALLVRGLYRADHIARLRRTADAEEASGFRKTPTERCSRRTLLDLLSVYEESGLLGVVREYLGGAPVMMKERTELRKAYAKPGAPGGLPWHQDASYFGSRPGGVNCWASVTGCGETSPGLVLLPRRLDELVGWDPAEGRAPLGYGRGMAKGRLAELAKDHPVVEPVMAPGDAILFDEMTLHRSGRTRWSTEHGIVSISWFFHPARFLAGRTPVAV